MTSFQTDIERKLRQKKKQADKEVLLGENGALRAFKKNDGFNGVGVLDLTEDREGGIWAAVSGTGLTRINRGFITSFTGEKKRLVFRQYLPAL